MKRNLKWRAQHMYVCKLMPREPLEGNDENRKKERQLES